MSSIVLLRSEKAHLPAGSGEVARQRYYPHLLAAVGWIASSERRSGGSAAQYTPLVGWSRSYPETTGYIIPTLAAVSSRCHDPSQMSRALRFGEWLLSIQNAEGSWNAGMHPPRAAKPSVFNTGQVLFGTLALWHRTGEQKWIDAASRGLRWLSQGMGSDGLWRGGDYRSVGTPSYYAHVLWPMLDVAVEIGDIKARDRIVRGVQSIMSRIQSNGAIALWGFRENAPAFTHTIAYTIRGIQGCGEILGDDGMLDSVVPALERLVRLSELRAGRLPGAFDERWSPISGYVCLTGNAQLAHCVLIHESRYRDLRLVSAAARMLDVVCKSQSCQSPFDGVRGGVPGSAPIWAPYMRLRYPNWAAKFIADGIVALCDRLDQTA